MSEGYDWRPYCSKMLDQGNCGSCTGFGSIGAWEPLIRIDKQDIDFVVDLSEADLFRCSGGTCQNGNEMVPVLERAKKGIATEICVPYLDVDIPCGEGRCPDWRLTGKRISGYAKISTPEAMKEALRRGPIVGTMAVHQSFLNYIGGVYESLGWIDPIVGYHCIAIVGFSDALGAWLIRNSWGTGWGEEGYAWLAYGDSEIEVENYIIEPDPNPLPEDEEPEPEPSDCDFGNGIAKLLNFFARILGREGRFRYLVTRTR